LKAPAIFQPGLMMNLPLLLSNVIEHAAAQYGTVEVVSRETHGPLFRYSYADCAAGARKLANALAGLGLVGGDAVGTIAWNNHRHLEAYYAVSGSGMVMHTCNPRLQAQQLIYIINHAEDGVVFQVGRRPLALHRAQTRRYPKEGKIPEIPGNQSRQMVGARRRGLPRLPACGRHWQNAKGGFAQGIWGGV